ncbi:FAD dependent oxidoreductase [Gemmatirosa kalamazoonensis]|uniref:FAD dependent oxidoreductase n=1 Tax=Gemmatirosa kalamazoonensis TaxID=861299 RepID=W0RR71_9BACT|nr:glycerol-3-phosphate dehydrogenase/oxidase [Gemmatirosa kalamazoonensis]AHG92083.1 FAD dependent oxidoreductase [Gemmatirosa kalamazoonensis]
MGVAGASRADRSAALAALADDTFDVLVVGGGITGAGVAREAALRGLRTALVERDDFAAGTSSRSSRLVHGGVRYLEHGHLGLVFEASRERRVLLQTAPHLVRPLAFTWPVYRGARVPRWKLEAGLALYDALALFRNVGNHRPLGRAGVLRREPALRADGLRGGSTYYDASTDDARLTLATALGARDAGATIANHAEVCGATFAREGGAVVAVRDTSAGGALEVRARVVVNATGPWGDSVPGLAPPGTHRVLGSKGAHVAVPAERIGNRGAVTMLSPVDGRVMFVLPAGRLSIIGTTETPAERGPDEVRASAADVDYLLRSANGFFPDAHLVRDDVVAAWAGIRPLAASRAGTAGAGSASREHVVERDPRGLVTVSGGKLTTYRAMAAEIVDAVAELVGGGRARDRARTATLPLPGGDVPSLAEIEREAARRVGDAAVATRLARAYGGDWARVWGYVDRDPLLGRAIVPGLPYVAAELAHAVEHELAATLADLLVRRVPLAFETRDNGRAAARVAADVVAPRLGWSADDATRALGAYDREAARLFAID